MALTEGRTLSDGGNEFKDKFWDYIVASIAFWPAELEQHISAHALTLSFTKSQVICHWPEIWNKNNGCNVIIGDNCTHQSMFMKSACFCLCNTERTSQGYTFLLEKIFFLKRWRHVEQIIFTLFPALNSCFWLLLTLWNVITTCWLYSLLTSEAFSYIFRKIIYFKKGGLIARQLKGNRASVVTWCPVLIFQPAQQTEQTSLLFSQCFYSIGCVIYTGCAICVFLACRWTCVCGLSLKRSTSTTSLPNSVSCISTLSASVGTPICPTLNTE